MKSVSLWMVGRIWRLWWVLLAGVLMVAGASAETSATDGDWEFTYSDSDSTATITKYRGTSTTPSIPSKVSRRYTTGERDEDDNYIYITRTYTVTAISRAFCRNGIVTSVSIPSTITTLSGFSDCTNLVSIACSVPPIEIDDCAFSSCYRLKTGIDLSHCKHIGSQAFMRCYSLEFGNLSLPNVTNIGAEAFYGCAELTAIELPSCLQSMGAGAFRYCTGLANARIDGTDLILPCYALGNCSNLQSVVIGEGVVGVEENKAHYYSTQGPFYGSLQLKTLEVGTGMTAISNYFCLGLSGLETVTFRGNIQSVGNSAFSQCTNLVSISLGGAPNTVGEHAFDNCQQLEGHIDLSRCTSVGNSAFRYCAGLTSIDLSSCLQSLGDRAFQYCGGLVSARIDGSDLTLPCYVLANCTNLQSVVIGDGVTGVTENTDHYDYAQGPFYGSPQLKTLEVGTGMTAISNYFCLGLSGLENATFRGNIQSVGNLAFSQCTNLVSISLGGPPKTIGDNAFYNCQKLYGTIDLSQCTSVGELAFYSCSMFALGTIDFSQGLTNIGKLAFYRCAGLESINLPTSLATLGNGAFAECVGLTSARIDGTDMVLPPCFGGCSNLESVLIGDGITGSSGEPFSGCNQLRTLDVGRGMNSIGNYFCNGLSGMETAIFRGNIQSIGLGAFSGCTSLVSITLGGAPKTIGASAFFNCRLMEGNIDLTQCTSLGGGAFNGCVAWLAGDLELSKITSIDESTFYGCKGLTSIKFIEGVTNIGRYAFHNCAGLSNVWFKGGVPTTGWRPFDGVASGARGYYEAKHREEWTGVIGADGKWQGLIMAEIPEPRLRVGSANSAEGSLTLAWDETATLEGVTYSVYRSANDTYSATDLVTNGLTGTSWTDTAFCSLEPIQKPLNYWVVADGGGYGERVSNRVETRRKYALCVGINEYADAKIRGLKGCVHDSEYMEKNLIERGGWPSENITRLNDVNATKRAIRTAISNVAAKAVPGDTFVYQHASHGDQYCRDPDAEEPLYGKDGKRVFLCVYDELFEDNDTAYNDHELAEDLLGFQAGVAVAIIVDACHSGGLFKDSVKSTSKATVASFDIATRVSALMDVRRKQFKARGANVSQVISSSEIGWATAVEYYETSLDCGFYHTDEWLENGDYGDEYWDSIGKQYNYPALWELGGVFTAGGTWGWWRGDADTDEEAGDKDGYCDVYEFWKQGGDCINHLYGRHAQCLNVDVLRNIELGVCNAGTGPSPMRTVRFNANGGNVSPSTKVVFQNDVIGEMPQPRRWGYDFSGWHTAAIGGSQVIESTTITASQTLYAHWMVNAEFSAWLERNAAKMLEANGGDYEAVAGAVAANGRSVWMCYLTGVSPEEKGSDLKMVLQIGENGAWRVGWTPDLNLGGTKTERVYGVEAKRTMLDETWTDVTEVEDLDAAGWRFFRVRVEPPEE